MFKKTVAATAIALAFMLTPAMANGAKLGTLTCNIEGGAGYLIGSSRSGECTFHQSNGKIKHYKAKFSRLGVDVGITGTKTVVWAVFGVDGAANGGLAGSYTGLNVEATAVVGIGANALVGGLENGIVLNPLSVSGQTGLNIAGGVANLRLM